MQVRDTQRRLGASLTADEAGSSRVMDTYEEGTIFKFSVCVEIIGQAVSNHGGRVFGGAGDSLIVEFTSAVEAVRCAIDIQQEIERHSIAEPPDRHLRFRIGV